jgi:hypothetical protein
MLLTPIKSQDSIGGILKSIEQNNKSIIATQQYWESKKWEYKTGLTLPNPSVQAQYLFGSPIGAGNQTDFFAIQPFDHPSSYKEKRAFADLQGTVSTSQIAALRQDVLLKGLLICLEWVYRNKLQAHYKGRKMGLDKLLQDFQKKLEKGDAVILDVNKTKLQLLEINQLDQENTVELQSLQTRLTQLNGGVVVVVTDTVYPNTPILGSFEKVEKEYEALDPVRITLEQEKQIAEKQLELTQLYKLPKFEVGYHYQGILGQRFNGLHAGVTVPIWEQKFRKEAHQAQVALAESNIDTHKNEHFYEIKSLYDRQAALKKSLDDYQTAIENVSNVALLDMALALGQITTIEYFLETSLYQNALLHYLKTEWAYQAAVAELMKYRL